MLYTMLDLLCVCVCVFVCVCMCNSPNACLILPTYSASIHPHKDNSQCFANPQNAVMLATRRNISKTCSRGHRNPEKSLLNDLLNVICQCVDYNCIHDQERDCRGLFGFRFSWILLATTEVVHCPMGPCQAGWPSIARNYSSPHIYLCLINSWFRVS